MSKIRKVLSLVLALSICLSVFSVLPVQVAAEPDGETDPGIPIYLDTSYSFAERAADLISRMTLQEKASQMISSRAPAIPRLGIETYGWWNECLHGVSSLQLNASGNSSMVWNTTSYPISLSLGSSWDPELMYREAVAISDEAREVVPDNRRNLTFYSPTVNLARDPRWGRNDEAFSEDPYLTGKIASQFVNGLEGKDMNGNLLDPDGYYKAIATLKHYTANNSEASRLSGNSAVDLRSLREYYTAPYRNIIREADIQSIMTAYNTVNGIPATASVYLLDRLLRQTFGFSGYITTDCDSISRITVGHKWIPEGWTRPVDYYERSAFAMMAGTDLECNEGYRDDYNYTNTVPQAVERGIKTETGTFTENDVDTALLRLFTTRMMLGEFDDPQSVRWIAEARQRVPQGTWTNSNNNNAITQTPERLALAREAAAKSIVLLKNEEITKKDGKAGKLLPIEVPTSGPFKVAVIGYFANPNSVNLGGYSAIQGSNANKNIVSPYNGIKNAIQAINPEAEVTYYKGFTDSGTSAANLVNIDYAAVSAAADADLAIVYVSTDNGTSREDHDRSTINLPGSQANLIKEVAIENPNTIAFIETVGQVDLTEFKDDVSAILWSSFLGLRKGEAIADVLLGNYNPSGHLPFTWYPTDKDIPNIEDYRIRPEQGTPGRTYMYYTGNYDYAFGHGLSYTTFQYSNLQIKNKNLDANGTLEVSVDVKNTGSIAGADVVQLYIATPGAPAELELPIKRLLGFEKINLQPDETKTVNFTVDVKDMAFFDTEDDRYEVYNGTYEVQIGKSSKEIEQTDTFQVTGELKPVLSVVTVKAHQEGDEDIPNRVFFSKNKKVIPKITVAMSDESLYGYIKKGESKPLPQGMEVTYTSNRPSVVSIQEDGTILTKSGGVATITATVSYEGVSESADFIVYVDSKGYLEGINVDGKPIEDFKEDRFKYSVCVPYGVDDIPEIEPVISDPEVEVTVTPATSIPGITTIVTKEGSFQQTYYIGIGRPPLSADFKTGALGDEWTVYNEDSDNYTFINDGLQITTQVGDFSDDSVNNLFLQQAAGDWLVQTNIKLSATPSASYQQAGLVVFEDIDNYIKLDYEYSGSNTGFRFFNTANGEMATVGSANISGLTELYLRLTKEGSRYTAYYSTDGVAFTELASTIAAYMNPRIGLLASNGAPSQAGSINATFTYLKVAEPDAGFPIASSITVNGKLLEGFSPEETNYLIKMPRGSAVPEVRAEAANPTMTVTVIPPESIPGIARVLISNELGSTIYSIAFGSEPVSYDFTTGAPLDRSVWTVLNEDPEGYSIEEGFGLRLPTQDNDFHQTGTGWKNVFVQSALGDWEVECKSYFPEAPSANYQQMSLLVWQDEDNYIKLGSEYSNWPWEAIKCQFGFEVNGSFNGESSVRLDVAPRTPDFIIYYRIKKTGNTYEGFYSLDGENFTSVGSVEVNLFNPQIGVYATKNTTNPVIDTYCQYIRVLSPGAPNIVNVEKVYVTTPVGIPPKLPQYVAVEYEDGSSGTASVAWDAIDPASYAQEGTFTVEGTVDGTEIKAVAEVTVTNEAVITLKGPASANVGETFEVTYGLANVEEISAQDITIKYNKNVFEYVGAETVDGNDSSEIIIAENDADAGNVRFIVAHKGAENVVTGAKDVLKVQFKAKGSGTGSIEANAVLGNRYGNEISVEGSSITVSVDVKKADLEKAIGDAQALYNQAVEGIEVGQYPAGTKDRILKQAITVAQAVYNNPSATPEEIAQAIADLNAAIEKFESLVITEKTGDINDIPGHDIGDIGLVAYNYGAKEGDPGWDAIKKADINGDGEIGLYELGFIAGKLIKQ